MRRERFPFDIDSIPFAFPLGFNLCGIHASLLCQNSLYGTVAFLYITPSVPGLHKPFSPHSSPSWAGVGWSGSRASTQDPLAPTIHVIDTRRVGWSSSQEPVSNYQCVSGHTGHSLPAFCVQEFATPCKGQSHI